MESEVLASIMHNHYTKVRVYSSSSKKLYKRACMQPVRLLFVPHIYNCIQY